MGVVRRPFLYLIFVCMLSGCSFAKKHQNYTYSDFKQADSKKDKSKVCVAQNPWCNSKSDTCPVAHVRKTRHGFIKPSQVAYIDSQEHMHDSYQLSKNFVHDVRYPEIFADGLSDIPLFLTAESLEYSACEHTGVLAISYQCVVPVQKLKDFYSEQMRFHGWSQGLSFEDESGKKLGDLADKIILLFKKNERYCLIIIHEKRASWWQFSKKPFLIVTLLVS